MGPPLRMVFQAVLCASGIISFFRIRIIVSQVLMNPYLGPDPILKLGNRVKNIT